jgi:hypothetical protein
MRCRPWPPPPKLDETQEFSGIARGLSGAAGGARIVRPADSRISGRSRAITTRSRAGRRQPGELGNWNPANPCPRARGAFALFGCRFAVTGVRSLMRIKFNRHRMMRRYAIETYPRRVAAPQRGALNSSRRRTKLVPARRSASASSQLDFTATRLKPCLRILRVIGGKRTRRMHDGGHRSYLWRCDVRRGCRRWS